MILPRCLDNRFNTLANMINYLKFLITQYINYFLYLIRIKIESEIWYLLANSDRNNKKDNFVKSKLYLSYYQLLKQ